MRRGLVHRTPGRNEQDSGKVKGVACLLGDDQMTEVDRVEDAAEYAPSLRA